ncbi:MAG TPA: HEAT repeat domain-containing protein [Candidatus Paceibacterota bacterium]|nr:HEAT repeat domain-containing protein [Candidatus Paceibacterota bacterium]
MSNQWLMRINLKHFLAISLLASIGAIVVLWRGLEEKISENRELKATLQFASAEVGNGSELRNNPEGFPEPIKELGELLRLRSEVGQLSYLKTEIQRIRSENQELRRIVESYKKQMRQDWLSWAYSVRTNGIRLDDVPNLLEALTNEAPSVRLEATKALKQIGIMQILETNLSPQAEFDLRTASKAALPGLLDALKDSDEMVRANAAIAVGFLRDHSDATVAALVQALNDDQNRVALSAAKALGRLEANGTAAVPALLQAAQSADAERRAAAITALVQIDPEMARRAGLNP